VTVEKKTKRRGKKKEPNSLNFELTCFNFVLFNFLFNVSFLRNNQ